MRPETGKESAGGKGSSPHCFVVVVYSLPCAWLRGRVAGEHVAAGTEWNLGARFARPRTSAPQHLLPHPGWAGAAPRGQTRAECHANRRLAVLDRSHLFLVKRQKKKLPEL